MKSMIRKLAALGFTSVAVSSLTMASPQSALALTEQQIIDKLGNVPVFVILDQEGQLLPTSIVNADDTEIPVPLLFIDSTEAEAFLEQGRAENPEAVGNAVVYPLPLSDFVDILEQPEAIVDAVAYIPSAEAIEEASQLEDQEVLGVPLFAAINAENNQFFPSSNNTIPLFFSLEDLQSELSSLYTTDPSLEATIDVEVMSFQMVLRSMTSNDPEVDDLLELIQFVPSSATLQYIQSLPRGDAAPSEEAPPSEAPAE